PAGNRPVAALESQNRLQCGERLDDDHVVRFEERAGLRAERSERGLLDFDERAVDDGVNAVSPDGNLASRVVVAVALLQFSMERGFHDRPKATGPQVERPTAFWSRVPDLGGIVAGPPICVDVVITPGCRR